MAAWVAGGGQILGDVAEEAAATQPLPGLAGEGPPAPPDVAGILFQEPGEGVVRLPVIDTAIERMRTAPILASPDYYAIRAAARENAFTITADITNDTIEKVRDLIYTDLAAGTSRTEFMAAVEAALPGLPISEAHLEQVYRNAVNQSFTEGQETVLRHPLVEDEFPYRVYAPIRDDRVRDEHLELETMGLDGTAVYHKDDPTWKLFQPPWDWNAVVPETLVEGRVMYALKTGYTGDVYKIALQSGRRLTVTANHPILTETGFVAACHLAIGGDLLSYLGPDGWAAPPLDDINNPPARIDQVFDTFGRLAGAIAVEAGPLDLHSDATRGDGKIEVVAANGKLMSNLQAQLAESDRKGAFSATNLNLAFLTCQRAASEFGFASLLTAASIPASRQVFGLSVPRDAQFCRIGAAADFDTGLRQTSAHGGSADTELFCDLQLRHPGFVGRDQIVRIDVEHYSGPVFDVQTATGYMVANGIVVSNCRCGWYAITVEQAAALGVREARRWLETGVEPKHQHVKPPKFRPDPRWDRSPFGVSA